MHVYIDTQTFISPLEVCVKENRNLGLDRKCILDLLYLLNIKMKQGLQEAGVLKYFLTFTNEL